MARRQAPLRNPAWLVLGIVAAASVLFAVWMLVSTGAGEESDPMEGAVHDGRATIADTVADAGSGLGSTGGGGAPTTSDLDGEPVRRANFDDDMPSGSRSAVANRGAGDRRTQASRIVWTGRVREAGTRLPLSGVSVRLHGGALDEQATTDEEGNFRIAWYEGVPAGLVLEALEHVDRRAPTVDFETEGEFELERSARLAGTLEGLPAEIAGVRALIWHQRASGKKFWKSFEAEVSSEGRFDFEDLEPGVYAATAEVPGHSTELVSGIDLVAGEEFELLLHASPAAVLEGRVSTLVSGNPVPHARLSARPVDRSGPKLVHTLRSGEGLTDEGGRFRIEGLDLGEYVVAVEAPWGARDKLRVDLESRFEPTELELELEAPATISGFVVDPDGGEVAGATVAAIRGNASKELGRSRLGVDWPRTTTELDGTFRMVVPAGEDLTIIAEAGDLPRVWTAIDPVASASERVGIRLEFPPPADLSGRVSDGDGNPVSGAEVAADLILQGKAIAQSETTTDEEGGFALGPLREGRFLVRASAFGYRPQRQEVELLVGQSRELELELESTYAVSGLAIDQDGLAIPELAVRFTRVDGDPDEGEKAERFLGSTDAFGRVRFDKLVAGEWEAEGSSFLWELDRADPPSLHVPAEAEFVLIFQPRDRPERASIRGVVQSESGEIPTGVALDGFRGGTLELEQGRFVATGLTPTRHRLEVSADGHAPRKLDPVDLVPGGDVDLGAVLLRRSTRLEVRLLDGQGQPAAGLAVTLRPRPEADGGARDAQVVKLRDQGNGQYLARHALPGAWNLRVHRPGQGRVLDERVFVPEAETHEIRFSVP